MIEHILPMKHRGATTLSNLAASCSHCNLHKGSNAGGIDPRTGSLCRLFDPRTDIWKNHFVLVGTAIIGRTAIGRTTEYVLAMNEDAFIAARESLMDENLF